MITLMIVREVKRINFFCSVLFVAGFFAPAAFAQTIIIQTSNTSLVYKVDKDGALR